MTGKVLSSSDYRLQITYRTTSLGHAVAIIVGAVMAGVVVLGWGL